MHGVTRALILAPLTYLGLFVIVRLIGKRTLANMNALDLLVTVALGSTIATFILTPDVSVWSGIAALACPLLLQFATIWMSSHSKRVEHLLKDHPALLVYDGEVLRHMIEHEMITEGELREAARKAGLGSLHDAKAIVLEADGQLSVIPRPVKVPRSEDEASSLHEVATDGEGID